MSTFKGRTTIYLFASLLLVTVAWWGCGGGTTEQTGGEPEQAMESTGGKMETEGEMEAAVTEVSLAAGEGVYKARCAMCHGEGGKGDGPAGRALNPPPRDHTDAEYMSTLTDEQIKTQIMEGKGAMPPHKELISDIELESVVLYVRSLSG